MLCNRTVFTAETQSTQSLFLLMFPAETPENIKYYRLWRTERGSKCKVYQYFPTVKLKDDWCSLFLPEGQVPFCFSPSQRKAKKRISLRPSRLERVNASGRWDYVYISMTSLVTYVVPERKSRSATNLIVVTWKGPRLSGSTFIRLWRVHGSPL